MQENRGASDSVTADFCRGMRLLRNSMATMPRFSNVAHRDDVHIVSTFPAKNAEIFALIDDMISDIRKGDGNHNLRKNLCQVDANGNKVGNNRTDIQYDDINDVHHNVEVDNNPKQSERHRKVVDANDPNAVNEYILKK